ncbi:potassium channel KAT3 isoform X2 [Nicotiana tomentosiformis]|uniref:potassium channel KAT3 isoform X2 n=1 Tax=Nicotiana tomentosiformis TaxID=4098 RepID=UPI0008781D8E|nr:potassium channel KAT3-like isoform X5 [Nicotiana tomentosiformis]
MGEGSVKLKRFVIAPYDRRYRIWQTFLVVLVAYSGWSSPFELAFKKVANEGLLPLDLVVDAFFAIDILLTFFVSYLDKSTYLLVDDRKKIAFRYVTHLGFPMDVASTIPFQTIYRIFNGKKQGDDVFGFLNLLRLWRLRRVSKFFSRLEKDIRFSYFWTRFCKLICRDAINKTLRYASKNRLPEGIKEQMLAHLTLKSKTAELQQEEVIRDLPKAIRCSIAQYLFHTTLENTYLFKGVSEDFIVQLVSEIKAEYFPPKVDIVIQNEIPTDFYIIVSGAVEVVTYKNGMEQFLSKLESPELFGEVGVIFNTPQPFTVRSKRLSQVVRISHHHFKQLVQPLNADGKIILSNFLQNLKGMEKEELQEIPLISQLLSDVNSEVSTMSRGQNHEGQSQDGNRITTTTLPTRVIIHGHHPHDKPNEGGIAGKLIHLPESVEDLLIIAEKRFRKRGSTIVMADGFPMEDLGALRENDHLYIV